MTTPEKGSSVLNRHTLGDGRSVCSNPHDPRRRVLEYQYQCHAYQEPCIISQQYSILPLAFPRNTVSTRTTPLYIGAPTPVRRGALYR